MTIAIMQPYFYPYIGYFQLMRSVDEFVVYDNIEFAKKGWINRNRILVNGEPSFISLPLKSDSDFLDIRERRLADSWPLERKKMLNRIAGAYKKAPSFNSVFPMVEASILVDKFNLFDFILNSIQVTKDYLGIKTKLLISSTIPIDHSLKSDKKVIAICKARNATTYINPIGGTGLYQIENFENAGINLQFLQSGDIIYKQLNNEFVPRLSIIDILMFNSKDQIQELLNAFTLLKSSQN